MDKALNSVFYLLPEVAVLFSALLALCVDLLWRKRITSFISAPFLILTAGHLFSIAAAVILRDNDARMLFVDSLYVDRVALDFKILISFLDAIVITQIYYSREIPDAEKLESIFLVAMGTIAVHVGVSSNNFLVLYCAVFLFFLVSWVLLLQSKAIDAAARSYATHGFLLAIASLGFVLIYAISHTIYFDQLAVNSWAPNASGLIRWTIFLSFFALAAALLGLFPMSFLIPELLHGAAAPIGIFYGCGALVFGIGILLKLCLQIFGFKNGNTWIPIEGFPWNGLLMILAPVSMTLGNLGALGQKDLKRYLGFLLTGQVGALLMPLIFPSQNSVSVMLFSLTGVVMSFLGINFVLQFIYDHADNRDGATFDSLNGLAWKNPLQAVLLTLFLLGLSGLPPVFGYVGHFYVLDILIHENAFWLCALIGMNWLLCLVGITKVFARVYSMAYQKSENEILFSPISTVLALILVCPMLALGLYWEPLFGAIRRSIGSAMW